MQIKLRWIPTAGIIALKRGTIPNVSEDVEQPEILEIKNCWWERRFGKHFCSLLKSSHIPAYDSAISPLDIYWEMATQVHVKICPWMFTTALRVWAQNLSAIQTDE